MAIMIQIRNVPGELHRELAARAAASGMSLSDYLKAELARIVARPTREQLVARLATRRPVEGGVDSATAIREDRDSR